MSVVMYFNLDTCCAHLYSKALLYFLYKLLIFLMLYFVIYFMKMEMLERPTFSTTATFYCTLRSAISLLHCNKIR